ACRKPMFLLLRREVLLRSILTIFILSGSLMLASAGSFAQRVTCSHKQASLREVLQDIRKQTEYDILCTGRLYHLARQVSVSLKEASIQETLNVVFADQPLTYTIDEKTVVVREKTPSEVRRTIPGSGRVVVQGVITGVVVDSAGNPLEGATVSIRNTPTAA